MPTYSSWLNPIERFYSPIAEEAIRRGTFTRVKPLVQRSDHVVSACNVNCQPFKGTATADSILEKLARPRQAGLRVPTQRHDPSVGGR